jgi:hypothetical protein
MSDLHPPVLRLAHPLGSLPATSAFAEDLPHSPDHQLDTARRGTIGSGGPLPHFADIQRSFGQHDVGHIRAYQGSRAAAAARAIGARAYTTGDRVAFAGTPDLHTAAHEAAHVVQQRAGVHLAGDVGEAGDFYERHADAVAAEVVQGRSAEKLLDQMAPAGSRSLAVQRQVVQRAIATNFGEFDTTTYDSLGPAGSEYGVSIELTFDPDPAKVNAKKIGLVQSLRSKLGGVDAAIDPTMASWTVKRGRGRGTQIDRTTAGAYANPLYAAGLPAAGDKLGDTATVAGWGQHGSHYTDAAGTLHHAKAILIDTPARPGRGNNSNQIFETAALAVEGVQSGTYMGSVRWGWSVDSAGAFSKLPLTRVSKGNPSAAFRAAARQWNRSTTAGTIKTSKSPTNVYDAAYSVSLTVARNTTVELTGNTWIHADLIYNEVTIRSGPSTGTVGRIKTIDMRDIGGGTPTINLP